MVSVRQVREDESPLLVSAQIRGGPQPVRPGVGVTVTSARSKIRAAVIV